MAKISNPFEHQHEHVHDDTPVDVSELDPAQKSLADALRVSFLILKVIMAILVILYASTSFYKVKQNEHAVKTRFGKIVEWNIAPGAHFRWPYPIEEIVPIRTGNSGTIALPTGKPSLVSSTSGRYSEKNRSARRSSW